jgi:RNase P/RNase MRP subunit p29
MKVQVVDEEALSKLRPRNIRLYLRTHDWLRREEPGGSDVWTRPGQGGVYEVIAPSSHEKRDFVMRVSELLRTISIAEDRSEIDVMRDMATMTFDVQYFCTHHAGPTGTAPLRTAAEAFNAAVGLISASTATIEEPRLVLPSRRSTATNNFMKKLLAGPTIDGSYVIPVLVPLPPRLTPEEDPVLFDGSSEPFERIATRHLNESLVATRTAAHEILNGKGLEAFTERSADGVSANLCEALFSLAGDDDEESVDVRFAWALDRPLPGLPGRVVFPSEALRVVKEAAREIRERIPEEEVVLRGNVVRLYRDTEQGPGEVTVAGSIVDDPSEKLRKVSVSLTQPDYEIALMAHKTFADVEMVGSLLRRGTRTYLNLHGGLVVSTPKM